MVGIEFLWQPEIFLIKFRPTGALLKHRRKLILQMGFEKVVVNVTLVKSEMSDW